MRFYLSNLAVLGISSFFLIECAQVVKTEAGLQLEYPQTQPAQIPASQAEHARWIRSAPPATQLFKRAGKRWTDEEVDYLVELREEEELSWEEIAEFFPERKWGGVKQKYERLNRDPLAPKTKERRLWTPEEDERLLELKREDKSWEEMAEFLKGRTPSAIKTHYYYITGEDKQAPASTRRKYTEEDDNLLLEALREGLSTTEVAQRLETTVETVNRRVASLREQKRFNPASISKKYRSYTIDELNLIHELRERGMSWKLIRRVHFPERNVNTMRQRYKKYLDSRETKG